MGNLGNRHPIEAKKIWNASRILRVILAQGLWLASPQILSKFSETSDANSEIKITK